MAATTTMASQAHLLFSFPIPIRRVVHLHPIHHKHTLRATSSSSVRITQRHHYNPATVIRGENEATATAIADEDDDILKGSTRTVTTLIGTALLFLKLLHNKIPYLVLNSNLNIMRMSSSTTTAVFFASLRDRPSGYLNTPLTVVAAGLGKWLDIYSGVLMVRVLLSWFPNIPWERQPLSAIRDLCDPYLNLFRNIIPPVFDTLDVSPLLAFAVLGTLGSILQTAMT